MKLRKVLDQEAIIEKNSISFLEHINLQSDNRKIINDLKRKLDFNAINADQIFCTNESKCLFGTKDISYYDDDEHISEEGSIMMEPLFLQTM